MAAKKHPDEKNQYRIQVLVDAKTFTILGNTMYEQDMDMSAVGRRIFKRFAVMYQKNPKSAIKWFNGLQRDD